MFEKHRANARDFSFSTDKDPTYSNSVLDRLVRDAHRIEMTSVLILNWYENSGQIRCANFKVLFEAVLSG